ncbi:farnesol dehydrogenase-like [Zootermopsis nevadensis]|uniref:farnesol dehydrogenase-like n=1 Tax=Zootermopsis nevadensis TaxID=136037 RepID=UPI000B8E7232|nr:farnesol dehydrogenase-like [Zootermopsis nevadensis]
MERWSGRVAVVTGASAGIGAAIAQELVKKGLKVVGLARRVDRVEELSAALSSESGKLFPLKCDIIRETDIKDAFKWIKSNLGGVDILVNNAGVASENSLMRGPVDSWRSILELNVLALSVCTKEAIQSMQERSVNDGHIIHMNSVSGHTMPPTIFPIYMYAASKNAVTILTEGLRRELVEQNSNIRVTSISPGLVKTEILDVSRNAICSESVYRNYAHLEAKDVAEAVLYVLGTPPHVQVHELIIKPSGEIS